MSPFHAGGGGGGGGGGGTWAATQVFEGGSKTVPTPHSVALPTAGQIAVTTASDATAGHDDGRQAMNRAAHRRSPLDLPLDPAYRRRFYDLSAREQQP